MPQQSVIYLPLWAKNQSLANLYEINLLTFFSNGIHSGKRETEIKSELVRGL